MNCNQQPDYGCQQRERAFCYNEQAAAVEAVGDDASIEAKKHQRPELNSVGDSECQTGTGQVQDQPVLSRDLEPMLDPIRAAK